MSETKPWPRAELRFSKDFPAIEVEPGSFSPNMVATFRKEWDAMNAVIDAAANVYFDDDGDHGTLELHEAVKALKAGRKERD